MRTHPSPKQPPLKTLLPPALSLSIGLHVAIAVLPLPSDPVSSEAQPTEEITLSSLPPDRPSKPIPTPQAIASPSQPQPAPATPSPSPSILPPNPAPIVTPIVTPSVTPSVTPIVTPSVTAPVSQPVTQTIPPPPATPSPVVPPPAQLSQPFANLPSLPGAQACPSASQCHQLSGDFRAIAQTLEAQMNRLGYQVEYRSDLEDSGQKIYQLTASDGTIRYLNILSSSIGNTTYLISAEPLSAADLQNTATSQSTLDTLLAQLSRTPAAPTQFSYPELFFTNGQPRPALRSQRLILNTSPDRLSASLTPALTQSGFTASPIGTYSGGKMYEIKNKAYTEYMNIIATQDGTGSIVVLWTELPNS